MSIWRQNDPDPAALDALGRSTMVQHLGIVVTAIGEDWLQATMPVDERTRQPFGLLHGGASVALAETLGSLAAWLTLPDPERTLAVGLEVNANHIRAVRSGSVTGIARPEHLGRSTQVWSIRINDEDGRLVSIARLTVALVDRQPRGAA
ncbi:MAG: hotdog fold thioesterase [Xanthomonadales bacterium]|nr:hotdog fold thioesterase [Xanthomonadales bacterium]